ncbi:ribonuclease H-like domain-containing protein [Tanacetum coccineum]
MRLMQFLMCLDDCYQPIRSSLLTRNSLPNVKDAYTIVSIEESHRGILKSFGVTESKMNATSFSAKSFNNNRRSFNNNNNTRGPVNNSNSKGPNPNLVCKNCGMIGHTIERCFELIGYPPSFKKVSNPVKQSGFKPNFNANIDVKGNDKQQPACNTPSSFTADQMRKLLNLINDVPSGSIHANMARLEKGDNLGTGSESGGLYLFEMDNNKSIGNINMAMSFNVSKDLWHNRLGHLTYQVLSMLKSNLYLSKNTKVSVCKTYHRDKQTRELFPLSDHKSKRLGELVHLDLWGPYRVTSKEGFKYFLTIVDDYSRAVWATIFSLKCDKLTSSPYDKERASSVEEGRVPSRTDIAQIETSEVDPATQIDDNNLSEGNISDPNTSLDGSAPISRSNLNTKNVMSSVRRSSRSGKMPAKFNDYVVEYNVKYGLEKYLNYSKLDSVNFCFATTLNKSAEPETYYEAIKDNNWIEAINNEIEALNRNNTLTITELSASRKPIGCKWLFKIKYKSSREINKYKARLVATGFSEERV